jgi:hypothetical protein
VITDGYVQLQAALSRWCRDWAWNCSRAYQRSTRTFVNRVPATSEKCSVGLLVSVCFMFRAFVTQLRTYEETRPCSRLYLVSATRLSTNLYEILNKSSL